MKKDKYELIFLSIILLFLVIGLFYTAIKFKINEKENNDYNSSSSNGIYESVTTSDDNQISDNKNNDNQTNNNVDNSSNINSGKVNESNSTIDSTFTSEEDLISYFSLMNDDMDLYNDENNQTFVSKVKEKFIIIVDFLFYGKEIKGYTFNELTLTAKIKVLKIAASIDNKIDKYFPNYKNTIKEKCSDLKGKIALMYLETTNSICESVGSLACQEAREDFNTMKNSFGYTWDLLKSASTYSYSKLKVLLSEWYQSIK